MIMSITLLIYVIYRVSCQSFRITFSVIYWGVPPRETPTAISQIQNDMVHIVGNRLFEISTMTVNYTSYDIQRDYDLINPQSHPDIMVVSPDRETNDTLPFWHAHILKIHHADVWTSHPDIHDNSIHSMNILWVVQVRA